jgi:Ribosomal protein S16.
LTVADSRKARNGRYIERVGSLTQLLVAKKNVFV